MNKFSWLRIFKESRKRDLKEGQKKFIVPFSVYSKGSILEFKKYFSEHIVNNFGKQLGVSKINFDKVYFDENNSNPLDISSNIFINCLKLHFSVDFSDSKNKISFRGDLFIKTIFDKKMNKATSNITFDCILIYPNDELDLLYIFK